MGSLPSDQESYLCPLHWKCRVLTTELPGKSLLLFLNIYNSSVCQVFCFFLLGKKPLKSTVLFSLSSSFACTVMSLLKYFFQLRKCFIFLYIFIIIVLVFFYSWGTHKIMRMDNNSSRFSSSPLRVSSLCL